VDNIITFTAAEYYCRYLNEITSAVEEFSENAQCVNFVKELTISHAIRKLEKSDIL